MMSPAFSDWLARGRNHQIEGRAVDAMLCFRRALREAPQSADAQFHLGEVLWQLGRFDDAIATWRQAAELEPPHAPSHQALADALLSIGDYAEAARIGERVQQLISDDGRATAAIAIARLESEDAAAVALAAAIAANSRLVVIPAVGHAVAVAIERWPSRTHAIVEAIAAHGAGVATDIPPALFASVVERMAARGDATQVGAWIDRAEERRWTAHDHDTLRRVALAASAFDDRRSTALARQYAALCSRAHFGAPPLVWPQRTAGQRLRVVIIDDAATTMSPAASSLRERFDVRVMNSDRLDARDIAGIDADVLIDLVGLRALLGPVLAQRPARAHLTVETVRAHNQPPLVDDVARDDADLVDTLHRIDTAIVRDAGARPDAETMKTIWRGAIDAHRGGDLATAKARYERVAQLQPGFAPAHHLLGVTLRDLGDLRAARVEFSAALAASPDYVAARIDAIRAAIDAHDIDAAKQLADEAAARHEDPPVALLRALGSAALAARDADKAATCFEAALSQEPADGETHYNHGVALQAQRKSADAARAYQRALAFKPNLAAADFNLGTIFMDGGNRDAAIAAFSAVIAREPRHVAAYKNLGEMLFAAGRIDEWRENFERFELNCPDALPLAVHALEVCQYCGEFDRVERYLDGLRNGRFQSSDVHELVDSLEALLYLLLFFDVEPELVHRFARTYDESMRAIHGAPSAAAAARKPGKLRIGYLSADLRNHVMGKMVWQAVRHHDRSRFDVAFYSLSNQRDEWTQRFESIADRFVVVATLPDAQAAARIGADDLDILVDLSTHTKGARPAILALKPARVQITHVASAGTLGLRSVDFKLTDAYADVPENQLHQLETMLPMNGCVYPYRHIDVADRGHYRRQHFGISLEAPVIGAFVTGLKLSRRCLSLWRQVLEQLPDARLAFSPVTPQLAPLYRKIAAAGGIDAQRIVFVPQSATDEENQARYALVDFVLDSMPFGGVNGTLEALDMGVPVVTLVGKRHAERTSYSILMNLGVTQTIAHTGNEYVAVAVRLANDRAFRDQVRAAIAAGVARSPLTDMRAHTRNLEDAYIEALRRKAREAVAAADATVR